MSSPAGSLGPMTEQQSSDLDDHAGDTWDEDERQAQQRPDSTGLPRVDAVIAAVADLAHLPLEEQVVAFETAHAELRSTLDNPDAPERG